MVHPLFYYTCEISPKFDMTQKKQITQVAKLRQRARNSPNRLAVRIFLSTFAMPCGPIRLPAIASHKAKRAFPLSSFATKSGKFQSNEGMAGNVTLVCM